MPLAPGVSILSHDSVKTKGREGWKEDRVKRSRMVGGECRVKGVGGWSQATGEEEEYSR